MIATEEIRLSMQEKIEEIRKKEGHNTSSHGFASLYIWKKEMGLSVALEKDTFLVRYRGAGEHAWFFPCGDKNGKKKMIETLMRDQDLCFYYMRTEDVQFLEMEFPGLFQIEACEESHEYFYNRKEQEELQGRKYAAHRNHIRRAMQEGNLRVEVLNENNVKSAMQVCRCWSCQVKSESEQTDFCAAMGLLDEWRELKVSGIMVYLEEEPYAVAAGYALTEDTFDLALAKQKSMVSGLSVYTKHQLISSLPKRFLWINAEEDLGIPGLRTMKQQMKPAGMIKMYKGSLKRLG